MNKIVWAVAAALPLLLLGCEKEQPKPVESPPTVKPDDAAIVAGYPEATEQQKADLLALLKAGIPKPTKVVPAVASGSEWSKAIDVDLPVDKMHCMSNGAQVPDDQCHISVKEGGTPDPIRYLRIGRTKEKKQYWAFIRTVRKIDEENLLEQFMFCPELTETDDPFVMGGNCTLRPHDEKGVHFVYLVLSYAESTGAFRSVKIGYIDIYKPPNGGTEVHNGEGHGGDS